MDDAAAVAANDDDPQSSSPNRTTQPPTSSTAVTVAASPHPHHHAHSQTLTLALPIQTLSSSNGGGGGRDDCWSEGATSALIDAWGERYLDLGRGSLKQKHWQDVADAVSARDDYTKPPKSDVQCKNRIDTLKKKYKSEKSKISTSSQSQLSTWPFFHRLDILIGPNLLKPQPNPAAPFPPRFPQRSRTQTVVNSFAVKRRPRSISPPPPPPREDSDGLPPVAAAEEDDGIRELTRAIVRFGEVYERVELGKTQQMVEAERQRMGFEREVELQRMQFFINAQLELAQLDRRLNSKRGRSVSGYDRRRHHRSAGNGNGGGSNNTDH